MAQTAVPKRDPRTGTWWFVVDLPPSPDGRRRQARRRGFPTKRAAQETLDGLRVAARRGGYVAPSRQRFGEFLVDDWLPVVRLTLDADTWRSYERNLRVHVIPRVGAIPMQAIDGAILNRVYAELLESGRAAGRGPSHRYSDELRSRLLALRVQGMSYGRIADLIRSEFASEAATITKNGVAALHRRLVTSRRPEPAPGLKPRTVRYIHTIVHAALRDAVRWERVERNAADRADPPSAKAARPPEMRVWSGEQLALFLGLMDGDRYRTAFLFLATTGCRRGEVLGLRWRDIDLDRGVVSIRQQLTTSGFKPYTKTEKPRVIELDRETVTTLRAWRASQAEEKLFVGADYGDLDLVFCHPDGRPFNPDRFSREFQRRLSRAPFAESLPRIRLHDLRHTWATLALIAGVDVKVVSERLGHSSPLITWQTYQHVVTGLQTDAAERVAGLIFANRA